MPPTSTPPWNAIQNRDDMCVVGNLRLYYRKALYWCTQRRVEVVPDTGISGPVAYRRAVAADARSPAGRAGRLASTGSRTPGSVATQVLSRRERSPHMTLQHPVLNPSRTNPPAPPTPGSPCNPESAPDLESTSQLSRHAMFLSSRSHLTKFLTLSHYRHSAYR